MTFVGDIDEVAPELILRVDDEKRAYVELDDGDFEYSGSEQPSSSCSSWRKWRLWWWVKLIFLILCLVVIAGVCIQWVGPYFMDKDIIPVISWETRTFTNAELAIIIFASVAIFPSLLLPSTPSMWVAGITFGYGFGFMLIMAGVAVGVSLPFFIGSLFHHRIQLLLEKHPKRASIIKIAGEGTWFSQFKSVLLIRISPFPYIIYNYCAVATSVKYFPYLLGSLFGIVPEVFIAIYTGIFIQTLADASHNRHSLSASQILVNAAGFCATIATTIICTAYAKKKLKALHNEDEQLLLA
uniref:VTT domain-containing protein n=1 Tax=Kalanchoe fedtschenkoi TaxID=63787 RepID=A0A7N0SZ39_KALFE